MAGPTIEFLGRVPDGQVESLMANCRAFIFPGEEDFGITPLEAMASGRPVIALRAGGARETVLDGITGLFFDEPTADSLIDALQRLDSLEINPHINRLHAESFDLKRFQNRLRSLVETKWEEHKAGYSHPTTGAIESAKHPVCRPAPMISPDDDTHTSNGHGDAPKREAAPVPPIHKAA